MPSQVRDPGMSPSLRLSAHPALVAWVLALLALSASAELSYQALVAIPHLAGTLQSETARRILARQAEAVVQALGNGRVAEAQASLGLEASNPDLRWLAVLDPQGRIALAVPPAWRHQMVQQSIQVVSDTDTPRAGPRIHVDPKGDLLTAVLPIPFSTQSAALSTAADTAPEQDRATTRGASPSGALYLGLDLRHLRAELWARRLSIGGWMPWLITVGLAVALMTQLAVRRIGRPPRRLQPPAGTDALGPTAMGPRPPAPAELAELADTPARPGEGPDKAYSHPRTQDPRYRFALEEAAEGIWDWDLAAQRVFYSPRCLALLGLDPDVPTGGELESSAALDAWLARIHPDDRTAWQKGLERIQSGAASDLVYEHRLATSDGDWRWVVARARCLEVDVAGQPLRILGTLADITDRKLAERSLAYLVNLETVLLEGSRALSAAQPEAVEGVLERVLGAVARRMDAEHACIVASPPEGRELRVTHRWACVEGPCRLAEILPPLDERLPRWMETLRHGEDVRIGDVARLPATWRQDQELLEGIDVRSVLAVPLRDGERLGGFIALDMESGPRDWRESELRALHLLADLVGSAFERRELELELIASRQRLEEVAFYDGLTGLPNRLLLGERMQEAMAAAVEGGTQLAVCYLDLDGFKPINDHHGRTVGDQVLKAAAARLRDQVRESDTVARLGGDEFVLLMGGFDSLIECANALDRLVKGLAQPYLIDDEELRVTASVGVILYPRDSHDADTLLRHADHAMYQAKQRGRNRVRFFDTVRDRRAHARRSQLERIGEAIDDGELRLHYQPKVDMRQGKVMGTEGLVRWQHPTKGLLPPGVFIPLLDGTELQQRLDWWVIGAGLAQLDLWHAQGLDLGLSLNISARSVQHEGFVSELRSRLEEHPHLTAGALSLEILESEALGDLDAVATVMERCESLGVRFALDDFGTGYSSLTYFRRLPAQILKIDQTFVRDMLRSKDDRNIVEGVVGMARAFQREVIAEGVESAAHGLMLLDMGCDRAQGYGVAEPMPPDQIPLWTAHYVAPTLWDLKRPFDWSSRKILDLLAMESVHRDWAARLLRSVTGGAGTRPPELAERSCGFGRWYYGEGREAFGDLRRFQALEGLHDTVHAHARQLLRAQDLGLAVAEEIPTFLAARDRFLDGLQLLQQQVLSDLA